MLIICTSKSVKRAYRYTHTHTHILADMPRNGYSFVRISLCWHISFAFIAYSWAQQICWQFLLSSIYAIHLSVSHYLGNVSFILLSAFDKSIMCDKLCLSSAVHQQQHKQRQTHKDTQTTEVSKMLVSYPIRVVSPLLTFIPNWLYIELINPNFIDVQTELKTWPTHSLHLKNIDQSVFNI